MKKCKFCYLEENGDTPSDRKNIYYKKNIKFSPCKQHSVQLFGTSKNDKADFCLFIYEHDGFSIKKVNIEQYLDFKYCPICGRKLNKEKGDAKK